MKNKHIHKGESAYAELNSICIFYIGSTIETKGQLRMFIKEARLIQRENGMTEEDGSELDIRKYTIRVSNRAFKEFLNHFEFDND